MNLEGDVTIEAVTVMEEEVVDEVREEEVIDEMEGDVVQMVEEELLAVVTVVEGEGASASVIIVVPSVATLVLGAMLEMARAASVPSEDRDAKADMEEVTARSAVILIEVGTIEVEEAIDDDRNADKL